MKLLWREPLVYFLLLSSVIFAESFLSEQPLDDPQQILVDRASLLRFIQQKTKAMDGTVLLRSFDEMSAAKRQQWISAYIRQQALYREAQALGLGDNDPVIESRLIQKLEFFTQQYGEQALNVSAAQLQNYYRENQKNYYIEPFATFTHVFFNAQSRGEKEARELALAKRRELNQRQVSFAEGIKHGERFPYHVNYVERTPAFVASHFGESLAAKVFDAALISDQWRGPYQSAYGSHVILLSRLQPGRYPALAEVQDQIYQDLQRQQVRLSLERAYETIIKRYAVRIDADLVGFDAELMPAAGPL